MTFDPVEICAVHPNLQQPEVWAAAVTWHDVFAIAPDDLVSASEGLVTDLKRG